ncbi:MAG: MarR family transcriptional regulator [Oscillospiraceae bacterium]|nr:MarR family transcriptional regulator [Oscillospiraceae bacterium]
MLTDDVINLYKRFRLLNYREMFGRIHEKDGSLSATEAFAADVIYLLEKPTITQLADTLGISQPNATYKVNNLAAKGYVQKTVSEDDRRECRLSVSDRFHSYYNPRDRFIQDAVKKLEASYSPEALETFAGMLRALSEAVD